MSERVPVHVAWLGKPTLRALVAFALIVACRPGSVAAQVRMRPDTIHMRPATIHEHSRQQARLLLFDIMWEDSTLAQFASVVVYFAPGFNVQLPDAGCGVMEFEMNPRLRRMVFKIPAPPARANVPCALGHLGAVVDLDVDYSFPIRVLGVLRSGDTVALNPPGSRWERAGLTVVPYPVTKYQRIVLIIALVLGLAVLIQLLRRSRIQERQAARPGAGAP